MRWSRVIAITWSLARSPLSPSSSRSRVFASSRSVPTNRATSRGTIMIALVARGKPTPSALHPRPCELQHERVLVAAVVGLVERTEGGREVERSRDPRQHRIAGVIERDGVRVVVAAAAEQRAEREILSVRAEPA